MGCCLSSPHKSRIYKRPYYYDESNNEDEFPDEDELRGQLRTFGTIRNNTVLIPDDIDGLPSTSINKGNFYSNANLLLYEADIDQGYAWRCLRPAWFAFYPFTLSYILVTGMSAIFQRLTCDEACCWVRKEYSSRRYFRVYSNRIEINSPRLRLPYGLCGCGSWNADNIEAHPFDRGAFGFRVTNGKTFGSYCCCCPVYGGVVLRQRCPCNGSIWPRILSDCGGCFCDEWVCDVMCCSYKYYGLARPDEVAFVCNIALQCYYEGRQISQEDMEKCIDYWKHHISEESDPIKRKRKVCCEPFCIPICSLQYLHEYLFHIQRDIPYDKEDITDEIRQAYEDYNKKRIENIVSYKKFYGPVRNSTLCQAFGCRRVFGRRGFCFCTEGCSDFASHRRGDPAPQFYDDDIDDDNDASRVLQRVLGDPPKNVKIVRAT